MLITSLVTVLALCQTALGLFMWFPEYRCVEDHTCIASDSKRSEEGAVERDTTTVLNIAQRLPKSDLPHEVQVRRLANRLARKYQRGTPIQQFDEETVARRDNKYNIVSAVPPTQSNSAGIDQDGTDFSYFASVTLGTSSTTYHMLLDTGAGQTWIMGDTCTSAPCTVHNTFGPDDSTTYEAVNKEFRVGYGTGDVSGLQATDSLNIAGLKLSMTFGVANSTSKDFNNFPIDGILGLNQGKSDYPNFLEALATSKLLKSNLFGVSLNRAKDGTNTGAINFGEPDTSRYTGDLSYTSVSTNAESDWAIPIDDLGVGDKKSGITGELAYLDTGTSFIFCPEDDAKTFHGLIDGSTSTDGVTYYVPCTTTDPAFFTFSGVTYKVSSEDWVGPMVNGHCTSNIYGTAVVPGAWLLGDTFLKNVYTVFDVDQNRVGLVAANAASPSLSSTTSSPTGGPISPSVSSSAALPSSASASSGSTSNVLETTSNQTPTGSSSLSAASSTTVALSTTSGTPDPSSPTGSPGLNGHQTASSGSVAAESSPASAASTSPTTKSNAIRLDTSLFGIIATLTLMSFIS